jgi:fermentation-respiration switch protein FrsA (DUF1100 family)
LITRKYSAPFVFIILALLTGCSIVSDFWSFAPSFESSSNQSPNDAVTINDSTATLSLPTSTPITSPTATITPSPTATEIVFDIGNELTIQYLRGLEISGSEITFEEQLVSGLNFYRHLVSYRSEGSKIYGLLTIPFTEPPQGGYKAIVFNHGYIPPSIYRTTERYEAYVNYLARSGFVVFKIDYRGHGQSEGEPTGSYFSPGYTIDSITALKSLQTLEYIDPQGIGMWGHSMAGNLTLRAMLIEPDVKAGVIWAGAVYSYDDFAEYGIDDNTYQPPATPEGTEQPRRSRQIFDAYGQPDSGHPYWQVVSLTVQIEYLNSPLQIHHAEDDTVVSIQYSQGLAEVLQENGKDYEFYIYEGGGHNLISPYFGQAMQRTVEFFQDNL